MAYVVPETVAELEGEREVERRLNMVRVFAPALSLLSANR